MTVLNIGLLQRTELRTDPFDYVVVPGFLADATVSDIVASYPDIMKGGSFPLENVQLAEPLRRLVADLDGPEFEQAVEDKFGVALSGQPKMYSLRGYCRASDGKIHTDSRDKIVTVLLYLNRDWPHEGGKLRLLRSGGGLDDYVAEVPPDKGTLLVFRRCDTSWHGHGPFEGVRRSIQMNWMVSQSRRSFHKLRHSISARVKRLVAAD